MTRKIGRWFVETRLGRAVFRLVTVGMVLGVTYAVIRAEVGRQTGNATRAITHRVTVIEEVSPYDVMQACLRSVRCRRVLEHPDRALREIGRGGDALQPGSTGHQPTGPRGGGHHQGADEPQPTPSEPAPTGHHPPATSSPAPTGSSAGAPPPPSDQPQPEGPPAKGAIEHAGETAQGAVEGVKETGAAATKEVGAAAEGAVCGAVSTCSK